MTPMPHPFAGLVRKAALVLLLLALAMLFRETAAAGNVYKWKDESGLWHFSDDPPPDAATELLFDASPAPGGGMFWRIEGAGPQPSYLLGTIHSEDERVVNFSPNVWGIFESSDSFSMEVLIDAGALLRMSAAMMFLDGRDLPSVAGERLFGQAVRAMEAYGIPPAAVSKMKPWAVFATLSVPKPKTGMFMDLLLYQTALSMGKRVYGLETLEEQLAVFDQMPMADQIALLGLTLEQLPELPVMFDQLVATYMADDLERMTALSAAYMRRGDPGLTRRFMRRVNFDRNRRMAQRMMPRLAEGRAFIAVGALHLAGEGGLLQLLQASGCRVTHLPIRE